MPRSAVPPGQPIGTLVVLLIEASHLYDWAAYRLPRSDGRRTGLALVIVYRYGTSDDR
jgi:hypothetical protein